MLTKIHLKISENLHDCFITKDLTQLPYKVTKLCKEQVQQQICHVPQLQRENPDERISQNW